MNKQIDVLFNKIMENYDKITDKELTELTQLINSIYNRYDPILLALSKEELIRNTDYITRATYELTKRRGIWDTSSRHYILSNLLKSRLGIDSNSRNAIFVEKKMWLYDEVEINGTYIKFKFTVMDGQPILLMKHIYGYNSITNIVERILVEINASYLSNIGFSLVKDKVAVYYRDLMIEGVEPVYDKVVLNDNLEDPKWSTIQSDWFETTWSEINDQEIIKEPVFFENNLAFTAYKKIIEILNTAKKSIIIIDPYFDDNTIQIIESLNENIYVKVLTNKLQGTTKTSYPKFKKERGNIELKITDKVHDRYVILDSNKIYLLGSSLNNFGDKATTIVPLQEPSVRNSILNFFEKTWSQGL